MGGAGGVGGKGVVGRVGCEVGWVGTFLVFLRRRISVRPHLGGGVSGWASANSIRMAANRIGDWARKSHIGYPKKGRRRVGDLAGRRYTQERAAVGRGEARATRKQFASELGQPRNVSGRRGDEVGRRRVGTRAVELPGDGEAGPRTGAAEPGGNSYGEIRRAAIGGVWGGGGA